MGWVGMGWDGMGWARTPCCVMLLHSSAVTPKACVLQGHSEPASPVLQSRYKKLCYRVVFPMELKLCNTTDDCEGGDSLYRLFAVVIHVGSGPNHGNDLVFDCGFLCDQPYMTWASDSAAELNAIVLTTSFLLMPILCLYRALREPCEELWELAVL